MPLLLADIPYSMYALPAALVFILLMAVFLKLRPAPRLSNRLTEGLDRLGSVNRRVDGVEFPRTRVGPLEAPTRTLLDDLADGIHRKLVSRLRRDFDLTRPGARTDLRRVIEHLVDTENPLLNRIEREKLIDTVLDRIPAFRRPSPEGTPEAAPTRADSSPR